MDTVSKIRTLLKQKGIAGYRMCADIGLSNSTFSQWNTGKTKPTEKNLRKVADYFNVPYETLLPDDEEKEKAPSQYETRLTGLDQELVRTILSLSESEKASLYAFLSTHKREE